MVLTPQLERSLDEFPKGGISSSGRLVTGKANAGKIMKGEEGQSEYR